MAPNLTKDEIILILKKGIFLLPETTNHYSMIRKILLGTFLVLSVFSCNEEKAKAEVNFEGNPIAESHRTVITEKYKELEVNFASYYIVITWGCGSGCVTGAMVDTRDGTVYSMPKDEEWGGNGTYIESSNDSEILLTVAVGPSQNGKIEELRKEWKWDEENKQFSFIKLESVVLESKE